MIQLSLRKRSLISSHKMNVICPPYDNATALSSQHSKDKGRKRKSLLNLINWWQTKTFFVQMAKGGRLRKNVALYGKKSESLDKCEN